MNILQESNFFLDSFFQPTSAYCIASPIVKPQFKKKFSCKYLIQIENESGFQVSRRIIGTKGCNMKKIIEKTLMEFPFVNNSVFSDSKKLIKLRLRGKGSGFLEGKRNSESKEVLNLCVSARTQDLLELACKHTENLIKNIYNDFTQYMKEKKEQVSELRIKKIDLK